MPGLNTYEIGVLVAECRDRVLNSFVRNVYGVGPKTIVLKTWKPGTGSGELWLASGYAVFYTEQTVEKEATPSHQVLQLRRKIVGKRITDLKQVAGERIVTLELNGYEVFVECMPPGNIALVKDGVVEWLLEKHESSARVLKIGEKYQPPPTRGLHAEEAADLFSLEGLNPKTHLVVALARDLGLGGKFAEELLAQAGLDKKLRVEQIGDEEVKRLNNVWKELRHELENPRPRLYLRDSELIPCVTEFQSLSSHPKKEVSSFSEAVFTAYLEELKRLRYQELEKKGLTLIEDLNREKEHRLYTIETLEKRKTSLELFISGVKQALDFWEVLWQKPAEALPRVREATGLEAEIQDGKILFSKEELKVAINKETSPLKQLGPLYEELKTVKKALEKLRQEIAEIEQKMETISLQAEPRPIVVVKKSASKPKPFREFVTSGGFRAMLGKDGRSNILLLKRHLEESDLVLHTEIPGSPAAILKNGVKASETDVEECAQMVGCYSRAWRENFSNVSVFAVEAEQVSFSPPSGQYLPKGSFMVYGPKNFYLIELRLAAVCLNDDEVRIVPYLTATSLGKPFVEIRPGTVKASQAATKILEILGLEPVGERVEAVAAQIPFGRCHVLDKLINPR
ncbi:MAG: NFACT family protein [Candidatus Caldarchaeum sp.]